MKHIKGFNLINEGWQISLKRELEYNREEDIRDYIEELSDVGLKEVGFRERICDENFFIEDKRLNYNDKPLYPRYTFKLGNDGASFNSDRLVELMQDITELLERLRGNGYKVNIDELTIIDSKTKDKRTKVVFEFSVYHTEDEIPWEKIFISKEERGITDVGPKKKTSSRLQNFGDIIGEDDTPSTGPYGDDYFR